MARRRSAPRTFGALLIAVVVVLLVRGSEPLGDWLREILGPPEPSFAPGEPAAEGTSLGPCRVRHVIDGDTLDVHCGARRERVRMLRVDTPEREDPGYLEATRALRRWVNRRELHLVFETPGRPERGDHGRLLAYVFVDGVNVNVEMVRSGWSPFYTRYGRGRFARHFVRAEHEARDAGRGLWGDR